jgi:hypothetical protein
MATACPVKKAIDGAGVAYVDVATVVDVEWTAFMVFTREPLELAVASGADESDSVT